MNGLDIAAQDPTYEDTYTVEYDIVDRQKHIGIWFDYFCRDEAVEEGEEPDVYGGSTTKGAGPWGAFPGFTDGDDKAIQGEQDDLHNKLFYSIQQSWFYCEHRAKKGIYALEKVENIKDMEALEVEFAHMRTGFKKMMKDEIDPRRLFMEKFTRYNIHQNEFYNWALEPFNQYEKVWQEATDLGHSAENNIFCDNFDEENKAINDRIDALRSKFSDAFASIVSLGEQGKSNWLTWRDHVKDFDRTDLKEAVRVSRDAYNKLWAKQIQCYIDKNGEDDEINHFRDVARAHTINLDDEDSMLCNFNRLHNRVRYWQYVPLDETRETVAQCHAGFEKALASREKILDHQGSDAKNTWTTPAEGALAHDKVEHYRKKIDHIEEFIGKWETLNVELYPKKGKTRLPITNGLSEVTREAMDVYYWYAAMGHAAMEHHHQDKSW